jgi:hypothetical protein
MHTRDAFSYQMRAVDRRQRLRENDHPCFKLTTEELSLCLSRACLGKLIIHFRTRGQKRSFSYLRDELHVTVVQGRVGQVCAM